MITRSLIDAASLWLSPNSPPSFWLSSAGPSPAHAKNSKQDTKQRSTEAFHQLPSQKADSFGSSDLKAHFGTRGIFIQQLCTKPFLSSSPEYKKSTSEHAPAFLAILTVVIVKRVLHRYILMRSTKEVLCLLTCVCSCAEVAAIQALCSRWLHWCLE